MRGLRRDTEDLVEKAKAAGWGVAFNGGHYQIRSPDGKHIVVAASTPGDVRSLKNFRARLRRAGLNI